jgi:hypothetical protein
LAHNNICNGEPFETVSTDPTIHVHFLLLFHSVISFYQFSFLIVGIGRERQHNSYEIVKAFIFIIMSLVPPFRRRSVFRFGFNSSRKMGIEDQPPHTLQK